MIQFFHPMFFKTKEDTKHFFATIGDCLLQKSENLIYYTSESSNDFINEIESYYKDTFHKCCIIININLNIEEQIM